MAVENCSIASCELSLQSVTADVPIHLHSPRSKQIGGTPSVLASLGFFSFVCILFIREQLGDLLAKRLPERQ